MNFDLSQEQQLLADSLKRFVANDYTFDARAKIVASPRGWSEAVWKALAEMGLMGLPIPAEHDGFGGSAVDVMVVMEAIGEGLLVEPYLPTIGLGAQFVLRGGSPEQKSRWLPRIAQGECRMAFAHVEPAARYDLAEVGLRARRQGDGYVLDGDKRVVLHGAAADLLVVSARTSGGGREAQGISLFLVDRNAPGVTVKEYRTIDELRAADVG